jgi:hypothetical protein
VAEENSCCLSNTMANAKRWREESKRERQEQFEELSLLQTLGLQVVPCQR